MQLVADLHLHSKYSRAVSPQMVIPQMAKWAKIKGIDLLGTGDWTHPLWLSELKNSLEERSQGIFGIKTQNSKLNPSTEFISSEVERLRTGTENQSASWRIKLKTNKETNFLLTTEISSIYSQAGKTRKIHNLVVAPSFSVVEKINSELKRRGCNLLSDGRPIVGLSAKNLLELVLSVDGNCLFIPCHIWTPWFSLYGANSGFDSIEECFGDLSKYICAVETGLSSDPQMNWQVPDLDNCQIVSFSDAHSVQNLGREATVLQTQNSIRQLADKTQNQNLNLKTFSYREILNAFKNEPNRNLKIGYTIEFYPEEGKYHYTGHRNCGVVQSPEETKKKGTACPVCGRGLTVGVAERVRRLSREMSNNQCPMSNTQDENGVKWIQKENRVLFVRLVPLAEIIAESLGVGDSAVSVIREYQNLIEKLGDEIEILMRSRPEEIAKIGGERLAEGIVKVRSGDIFISPGFDGEYGKVAVWGRKDKKGQGEKREQMGLF